VPGAVRGTRIVRFGGHGERVAVLKRPEKRPSQTPSSSAISTPCYRKRFRTYPSIASAIEAAGGIECISFNTNEEELAKMVGNSDEYVITPIQQIWPALTEKQLRSLLHEVSNKRSKSEA
jgi:hypothetical protein